MICADGLLLEGKLHSKRVKSYTRNESSPTSGHDVKTDESALTGEPKLMEKSKHKPILLSGRNLQSYLTKHFRY
jgi:hypothetical protein